MSGLITIKINPSGLLHTLFSQPLKQRTFPSSMHLAMNDTEVRPGEEYLLLASNKVLNPAGCSKGMAREKETHSSGFKKTREGEEDACCKTTDSTGSCRKLNH